ncbi:DUF3558 domain-containing protein [Rhodococcus coprophilus]|uniref:DUF3558 domain-containing protein n=1 Tax=Rhodococcus coprophilus TaxID=38310 RepID=UPI00342D5B50
MTTPVLASAAISGSGGRVGGCKRVVRAVALLAVLVTVSSGCASGTAASHDSEAVETPTSTTRTPRVVDDSGRPQITFDPCLDIPDEVLVENEYDPRSKESTDYPMGTYSFIGCRFKGTLRIPGVLRRYGLSVLSGNVTMEEEKAKNDHIATESRVNGRRALIELDPEMRGSCAYVLEAEFGIVIVSRTYHADHSQEIPRAEWCAGFDQFVSAVEPLIPS